MAWRNRRRRRGVVRDVALRLGFVAPALAKLQMTVVRDLRAWLPGVEGVLLCEFHLQWYWSALLGGLTFGVGAACVDPDSVGSGRCCLCRVTGRHRDTLLMMWYPWGEAHMMVWPYVVTFALCANAPIRAPDRRQQREQGKQPHRPPPVPWRHRHRGAGSHAGR